MSSPPACACSRGGQRSLGRVDADHVGTGARELLGQQAAAASDVDDVHPLHLSEARAQLAHQKAHPRRVQRCLQDVQKAGVVPPGVAETVIQRVVDRHGALPRADIVNRG